jgi:hypothetical protein
MNNLNIALDIWKSQYETDFALLDSPQEQIEFIGEAATICAFECTTDQSNQ